MTRKLLIVLVNTDPRNPEELGAPFYHAAVAAAMDYEVDVICAANRRQADAQGRGRRPSASSRATTRPSTTGFVTPTKNGARFWACPANLDLFDMTEQDLIPECKGLMGAAAMLQNIMSDGLPRADLLRTGNGAGAGQGLSGAPVLRSGQPDLV